MCSMYSLSEPPMFLILTGLVITPSKPLIRTCRLMLEDSPVTRIKGRCTFAFASFSQLRTCEPRFRV